jgi:spore coat polysaccharide biosynthesis protein SpsF (cytidylyltransferase family)
MMVRVWERTKKAEFVNLSVVATVEGDTKVTNLCDEYGIKWFAGSERDIIGRLYGCAKKFNADWIIRVWGDSPLVSPDTIDDTLTYAQKYNADYCYSAGVPKGQVVAVMPFRTLEMTNSGMADPKAREWSHQYFIDHPKEYNVYVMQLQPDRSHVNLSVDTPEDLERIKEIWRFQEIFNE